MERKVIHIKWEGPYPLDDVINKMTDYEDDCGLYQIYGKGYAPEKKKPTLPDKVPEL